MIKWIVAALIVIPALEMWSIIRVGQWIGGFPTFGLILLTGFAGAQLARLEGRKAMQEAQRLMQAGQPPGRAVLDGLCVLAGGLLLISPGFFTDAVGLTLLFPLTRPFYRAVLLKWLEKKLRSGSFTIRRR